MEKQEVYILYEDNDIICCEKPSGVSSQSDKIRDFDMVNRLKNHVVRTGKEIPFIGVVHRLDKPVGGLMIFAKNEKALSSLGIQFQKRTVKKKYLAVVTHNCAEQMGEPPKRLCNYLKKNPKTNLSEIALREEKNAKEAILEYRVLETKGDCSLLEVELFTGRHHQIRVQLSNCGLGIWGDTKYNKEHCETLSDKWVNIALYSYYLEFNHPQSGKKMLFTQFPKKVPFIEFKTILE